MIAKGFDTVDLTSKGGERLVRARYKFSGRRIHGLLLEGHGVLKKIKEVMYRNN